MRIYVTSVLVDDQAKALDFYTNKLGFQVKHDIPMGAHRWLTLVSPENPDGTELLLEPSEHPAAKPWKAALLEDGIPATSFMVDDLNAEYARLVSLGVSFTREPIDADDVLGRRHFRPFVVLDHDQQGQLACGGKNDSLVKPTLTGRTIADRHDGDSSRFPGLLSHGHARRDRHARSDD